MAASGPHGRDLSTTGEAKAASLHIERFFSPLRRAKPCARSAWIEDFAPWQVRTIGALEVLAALGMTLPYFVPKLPKVLVSAAAGGLAITMIGAIITHVTRQDPAVAIVINCILLAMAVTVAVKRFGERAEA